MKNIAHLIIVNILVVFTATAVTTSKKSFSPKTPLDSERTFKDYVVRTYNRNIGGQAFYEILRKKVRVYSGDGFYFYIGSIREKDKTNSLISVGADITGDGEPSLVVSEWTGGAHGCYLFHVFEIGKRFRHIQTIDTVYTDTADFENLDSDSALEFKMNDWTFAYWRVSFAGSPAPEVILKYDGKKYAMACDIMRKPSLSPKAYFKMAADIRWSPGWEDNKPPEILWEEMLDLIYTGNNNQAWDLFKISWPPKIAGKEDFLAEFKDQLAKSPFWKDVQKLNTLDVQQVHDPGRPSAGKTTIPEKRRSK